MDGEVMKITDILLVLFASLVGTSASAQPIIIYGNSFGLWSPTHPLLTGLSSTPPEESDVYEPDVQIQPEVLVPEEIVIEPRPIIETNAPSAPDVCFISGPKPSFC